MGAYRDNFYEVMMWPVAVTTVVGPSAGVSQRRDLGRVWSAAITDNVSGNGFAAWGPGLVPHMVRAVGVEMLANLTDPMNIVLRVRPQATNAAATPEMIFPIPTTAATGKVALRYATQLIEVEPGEKLIASVTTAVDGARGVAYLLVCPRWEHPATLAGVTTATG